MRTWTKLGVVLCCAAFLFLLGEVVLAGHGGKLPFETDVQKGFEEAKRTGKPAVLYFTASW